MDMSLWLKTKIQQNKMFVTCQRSDDLFLFGLIWQYSTNQNQYNGCGYFCFKVNTTILALHCTTQESSC